MRGPGRAQRFLEEAMLLETGDCILWPYAKNSHGYGRLGATGAVHRLACTRAHGPAPAGMVATHGPCHNRLCFNPRHLSWATSSSNTFDMIRDGTMPQGEKHGRAKLSTEQVVEIRDRYSRGGVTQYELAEEFGISQVNVSWIVRGKGWKHLAGAP